MPKEELGKELGLGEDMRCFDRLVVRPGNAYRQVAENKEKEEKLKEDKKLSYKVETVLQKKEISSGFICDDIKLAVFTDSSVFKIQRAKTKKKLKGAVITSFADIEPGDLVVHNVHGIGRFEKIEGIVVGLPLQMDGEEGAIAKQVRLCANRIAEKYNLPVFLIDERYTSKFASAYLSGRCMREEKQKKVLDAYAAARILQKALDLL